MEENINIYFIKNTKNEMGGNFYNVYKSSDEKLDLKPIIDKCNDIDIIELKIKTIDPTFKKIGGIIIRKNETIGSTSIYTPDNGEVKLDREEQDEYTKWLELDNLSSELYNKRKKELEKFMKSQKKIDKKLAEIEEEKNNISEKIKQKVKKRGI